jgi:hypothetical protein
MDALPAAPSATPETPDETIARLTAPAAPTGSRQVLRKAETTRGKAIPLTSEVLFFGLGRSYVIRKRERRRKWPIA